MRLKTMTKSFKSIIDPKFCIVAFNHYCAVTTFAKNDRSYVVHVPPDVGVMNHYRKCKEELTDCKNAIHEGIYDDTVLRYKDELVKNVHQRLHDIGDIKQ